MEIDKQEQLIEGTLAEATLHGSGNYMRIKLTVVPPDGEAKTYVVGLDHGNAILARCGLGHEVKILDTLAITRAVERAD